MRSASPVRERFVSRLAEEVALLRFSVESDDGTAQYS